MLAFIKYNLVKKTKSSKTYFFSGKGEKGQNNKGKSIIKKQ